VKAKDSVQSVGRALELLDLLGKTAPDGLRVTSAAKILGVDPGTTSRMLSTLVRRGYASKLPDRSFTVGIRSLRLASRWIDSIVASAAPRMQRIAEGTGETVHLVQLLAQQAVTVARTMPGCRPPNKGEFGDSYPIWATAAGHALLAAVQPTDRFALLPSEPYEALTDRTPTTWAQVWASIQKGLREDIFVEEGQFFPDFGCAAAPLISSGRGEVLAVAVSYRRDRDERHKALVRRIVAREARDLSVAV
jgi:IclR family transcriptional regulator, acetate operon repressor